MSSKHTSVTVRGNEAPQADQQQPQQPAAPVMPTPSPATEAAVEAARQEKAGPTPLRYNADTGEVAPVGSQRARLSGADFNQGAGILATARTRHGGPVRGPLTGDHFVTGPGGLELSVADAEAAGLIRRGADGRYEEMPEAARVQASESEQVTEEYFPDEIEQTIQALAGDELSGDVLVPLLVEAAQRAAEGKSPYLLGDVVSRTGLEPHRAKDLMNFTLAAFAAQAASMLKKGGMSDQGISAFHKWAREAHPDRLKAAMVAQVTGRTLGGLRSLAKEYAKMVPPSPEVLNRAGYQTREENGETLVLIGGMWQSVRAAARNGLL